MSQLFASGGQSTGVSASTSVFPINTQDWLDLLAVQGTLKSLLQHHSSKASILWCSAYFIVQLSHPYMTTGKTLALTRQMFVGKVMSLLFNILSRLVMIIKMIWWKSVASSWHLVSSFHSPLWPSKGLQRWWERCREILRTCFASWSPIVICISLFCGFRNSQWIFFFWEDFFLISKISF